MMADKPQVIKLAQPGYDALTAGDENLVYSSGWPLLKIYKQGSTDITDFHHPTLMVNHNLGYPPLFWYFSNETIGGWLAPDNHISEQRAEFNGPSDSFSPAVTNDQLLFATNGTGLPDVGTLKIYYYIFALDISKPYTAPSIKSGGVIGPRNIKTVFKLAKQGKSISSTKLEDYIIHSRARSPLIHSVTPGKVTPDNTVPGAYSITARHNLGYTPIFFAFDKQTTSNKGLADAPTDSYVTLLPASSGATSYFTADEQQVKFTTINSVEEISIVILKDPFAVDYIIPVNV